MKNPEIERVEGRKKTNENEINNHKMKKSDVKR